MQRKGAGRRDLMAVYLWALWVLLGEEFALPCSQVAGRARAWQGARELSRRNLATGGAGVIVKERC